MMRKDTWLTVSTGLASLMMFGCAGTTTPKVATVDPAVAATGMCGAPTTGTEAAVANKKPMPVLSGLAPIAYDVRSSDPTVQIYFNQGLALLYGFEYEAAYDSFKVARQRDGNCAMCAWGMAMALGPNINRGEMSPKDATEARGLVSAGLALPGLTDKDRALLNTLAVRYAPEPPKGQNGVFAEKYTDALYAELAKWPEDDFIAVLAAEAAMNVRPWDYWEAGGHKALPWAAKAIATIEDVLKRSPDQPEAIHLYIHLTEASDNPSRAEPYADKLGKMAPNSPHLVHMPSHTYYPVGRFADAIRVNVEAIRIDEGMARDLGEDPAYYGYYFHHATFIMSAAQQVGDRATAMRLVAEIEKGVPLEKALKSLWLQGNLALAMGARGQFQSPQEVVALSAPDKRLPLLKVVWHAARAEAYAKLGDVRSARREVKALQKLRAETKMPGDIGVFLQRTEEMSEGRVELAASHTDLAIAHFKAAAATDAKFSYMEPPISERPSEIALGRALLTASDGAGAKAAFERALKARPGNAYALWGKAQAEIMMGDATASQKTLAAFNAVWLGGRDEITLQRL